MALKGKTALVTGGCGGLGKAISEAFLNEGANLAVCDISRDLLAEFKDKVAAGAEDRTLVLESNITDEAALDDLFKQAVDKFGQLDFICNSAGIMDDFSPAGDMAGSLWDKVIALNLTAPAMITQRAVKHMSEKSVKGSIVNIASVAGLRGFTAGCAYTVSKHGLLGLTKNTAAFYGPKGIRCNAIAAGAMPTNIANDYMTGKTKMNMEGFAFMRKTFPEDSQILVETEKVAKLVVYLCSDAGSIVNGATWTADGGTIAN